MARLVSVCIPTFNQARYISETIESVLNQTFVDFELIIVDNASTDHTEEIVSGFSDPRISYFRNNSNIGMVRNWNRCLELANGKYVTILSSDDRYRPTFLEKCVDLAERYPNIKFVHTGTHFVDERGQILGTSSRPGREIQEGNSLFRDYWSCRSMSFPVHFVSTFYFREVLQNLGGFTLQLEYACDAWAWLLACIDGTVGYIPEPLTYYRMHFGSEMGQLIQARGQLDERFKLAELVFTHPLVRKNRHLSKLKKHVPAVSVYRAVNDLRAMRRNGTPSFEIWNYYRNNLFPIRPAAAIHPWSLFFLLLALLPPNLLTRARKFKRKFYPRAFDFQ